MGGGGALLSSGVIDRTGDTHTHSPPPPSSVSASLQYVSLLLSNYRLRPSEAGQ